MSYLTVTADETRVGDQIYLGDDFAKNENHRWGDVKKVRRTVIGKTNVQILIVAGGRQHWYRPDQQVSIQRFD